MIKKLSVFSIFLGLVLSGGCSGSSSSPPPVPTPSTDTWGVTLTLGSQEISKGQETTVIATVTKNSAAAPDGTLVAFQCLGCVAGKTGFLAADGSLTTAVNVTTGGGKAGLYFKSTDAGTFTIRATVHAVSASTAITVKEPVVPPNPHLQIFDIVPDEGSLDGGEQVTLYGKDILTPVTVKFTVDGLAYEANVVQLDPSGTSVQVVTPKITAADPTKAWDADVEVKSGPQGSEQTVTVPKGFTFTPTSELPQIYQLFPSSGSAAGGDTVTIFGQSFQEPVQVKFTTDMGEEPASVQSVSQDGRQIVVTTPQISVVPLTQDLVASVTVINRVGTGDEKTITKDRAFIFKAQAEPPEIYQVYPDHGNPRGGDQITIFGANFKAPVKVQFVTNNGTFEASSEVVSQDGRQVQVITPQVASEPLTEDLVAKVVLVNAFGTPSEKTVEKEDAFVFTAEQLTPQIATLSPISGPVEGGTQVTIFAKQVPGSGFQFPVQVVFSGNDISDHEAQVISVNQYQIVCLTPDIRDDVGAKDLTLPIAVDVKVTNVDSGLSDTATGAFTYGEPLMITGNTPTEGPMEGGNLVTIFGSGFRAPLSVIYSAEELPVEVVSVSGSQIIVKMPALVPPRCESVVSNFKVKLQDNGTEAVGGRYTYIGFYPLPLSVDPVILSPPDGHSVDVDEITIHGERFQAPVEVAINGVKFSDNTPGVSVTVVDEHTITVSGIQDKIGPDEIGLHYDTTSCVANGVNGVRDVATAVDVSVANLSSLRCEVRLPQALTYEPYDDTCRIAAVMRLMEGGTELKDGDKAAPFETVANGQCSPTHSFTLENIGGDAMTGISVGISGPFQVVQQPQPQLNVGESTSYTVKFCPTVDDDSTQFGLMTVTSNASNSPIAITLQGDEASAQIGVQPQAITFFDTQQDPNGGNCTQETFTISNSGQDVLNWSASISGTDGGDFNISGSNSGSIPVNGVPATVTVSFCPRSVGIKTAQVDVTSNDPNNPTVSVSLQGTGTP